MKTVVSCVDKFEQLCPDAALTLKSHGWTMVDNLKGYPYDFAHYREALSQTEVVIAGIERWNAERFESAPHLRMIVRFGTGVDTIDLQEAHERGIEIRRVVDANTNAVAEQTIALMYALLKHTAELDRRTKEGQWYRPMCRELSGKRLGFLGFGRIAQAVAHKLQTSDVLMAAYDVAPNHEAADRLHVRIQPLEEVLSHSDIVSLHLPLTPETEGIVGEIRLASMKPGSLLINTARGKLVDQKALVESIRAEHLGGAALDVFDEQPLSAANELAVLDRVVCSPYISSRTEESMAKTGTAVASHILSFSPGEQRPPSGFRAAEP